MTKLSYAETLEINAKYISIDKKEQTTVFKEKVTIQDEVGNLIKSNYANYNKNTNFVILKENISAIDKYGNLFESQNATYNENEKILKTDGKTKITTSEGYIVNTKSITLDNIEGFVSSNYTTVVNDLEGNIITLDNFQYNKKKNIFKSLGNIKIFDKLNNTYEFSQIYINEKKKEIIGTDVKTYLNQEDLKENQNNKPRIFSNAINIKNENTKFIKSTYTVCDYRKNDKCPPWELRASEMNHDKKSKTIYYDNAVIRIYNIPIFYLPKLSHPDPTVNRRSGFLIPSFSDTKNLGSSLSLPYYWAIKEDKDLTINNRLFFSENPLFTGEYRQVFKDSNFVADFGFTEGYKKNSTNKKTGDKSHFFAKFIKKFEKENTESNLELNVQHVSNDKYLKLYKVDSNLVDYEKDNLENYIDYSHFNDKENFFFALKASSFETLKEDYNDKYEFILPHITLNKNLFNEEFGSGNFQTNFKVHNYDTNKYKQFLINDFEWAFNQSSNDSFYDGKFLTNIKNVNYKVEKENKFKPKQTHELFGALGYLASVNLIKKENNNKNHFLTPKMLIRYAPNFMRKDDSDAKLHGKDLFSLDRLDSETNFESGTNLTLGLDYELDSSKNKVGFNIAQIINEKNNKKMPSSSSLDKRFSDLTGGLSYDNLDNFKLTYDYSLDQNFKTTNFNEIKANYILENVDFNLNYLEENNSSKNKEYVKSSIEIKKGNNGLFTFNNKRNLITDSSEYYNLSYEYINDCLRAGLVYRREFYNDSELEAENSLMFKVTLTSFGSVITPGFNN